MSWDQDDDHPKRRRRRVNLAGPLILITMGLVFLMANMGLLGASPWQLLWRWWPLILVVVGLEVLLGVLGRWSYALSAVLGILVVIATLVLVAFLLLNPQAGVGSPEYTSRLTQPLGDVTQAEVTLELNFGSLQLSALPTGGENLLEARFAGRGEDDHLHRTAGRYIVDYCPPLQYDCRTDSPVEPPGQPQSDHCRANADRANDGAGCSKSYYGCPGLCDTAW